MVDFFLGTWKYSYCWQLDLVMAKSKMVNWSIIFYPLPGGEGTLGNDYKHVYSSLGVLKLCGKPYS